MPKAPKTQPTDKKAIHPNSRRALQMARKAHRDVKKNKINKNTVVRLNVLGEKVLWFRDNLDPSLQMYTSETTKEIIQKYLSRFKDELEQINTINSTHFKKVRSHASREDAIRMTMERELEEFEVSGFEIPDLFNIEHLNYLRQWNGELRYLQNIKLRRYTKQQLEEMIVKEM